MIAIIGVCAGIAVCLGLFLYVWRINNRRSIVITPFLLFAVLEMFVNWPAGIVAPMVDGSWDFYALGLMLVGFVSFLIGVLVASATLRHRAGSALEFRSAGIAASSSSSYVAGSLVLCVMLLFLSLMLYRGMPPLVDSIGSALSGSGASDAAVALGRSRQLLTKDYYFGGEYRGQGLLRQVLRVGWPFLTAISLTMYLKSRRRSWAMLSMVWFALTFVFVAGEGTRAPFLFSIVFLVVLVSITKPLRYGTVLGAALAFVGLMIVLSLLSPKLHWAVGQEDAVSLIGERITDRIVYGNGTNTVAIVDLVRDGRWDYRHGEVHLQHLLNAIPGVQSGVPLANQLYQEFNPRSSATTYATATYFGDVFLDFGPFGVVITYFLLGAFIACIQKWLFMLPRTVLNLPAVAYAIFTIGFIPLIGVVGVLAVLPVVAAIYLIPALTIKLLPKRARRGALRLDADAGHVWHPLRG